jgi:DNA modification methylase
MVEKTVSRILQGDCIELLENLNVPVHLTFLDPPYNQGKDYRFFDDDQPAEKYWKWLKEVSQKIFNTTAEGGCIYFMQREKNAEEVLKVLRETQWTFQNLIIWKKMTSAVPSTIRYSKQYQVIAFATKGRRPYTFNRLRIDYPPRPNHKYGRENGIFVPDVWDDIRELTSGYYAGDEALRDDEGNRVHKQQTPIELLLRIILSSTDSSNMVLDPMAGTGPAMVVAKQLDRNYVGIEIDPQYVKIINDRLDSIRPSDDVMQYWDYYRFTPNIEKIWTIKPQRSLLEEWQTH